MKKVIVLMLVFVSLLMAVNITYAVTTLYIGRTTEGNGTTRDYQNKSDYTGDINDTVIDFTNISEFKKIKVDVDYEFGDFKYNNPSPTLEIWNAQVGYPVINREKGLVYVTFGELNYNEYSALFPKQKATSNMLGLNIIATPTDRFQFEIDIQHSVLGGSSKLYTSSTDAYEHSAPEVSAGKAKIQYEFTDNFGFNIQYRVLDIKIKQFQIDAVNLSTTTAGFIYRF